MLFQLDAPFLSAHNERQNHTFEMARHVFHDGWRSIVTPKVSDSMQGYEAQPYTAVLQEVPFHGVIGWPLTLFTSHERAVVRIVSTVFALIAIQLLYWILRFWLPPAPSAAGAILWAMAPLTLHFGQVPIPDILCTTGMLASFWFALRGRLPASSGCFLFAVLAKMSVMPFGLPILVALLIARNCSSARHGLLLALAWGWPSLLGLILWTGVLYWFAPPTSATILFIINHRGDWASMVSFSFYKFLIACLFPFGLGVLGFLGMVFAMRSQQLKMDQRIKWAIIWSNIFYLIMVLRKVSEPQYMLPMLAWCAVPAAFGFNWLMAKLRAGAASRVAFGAALALHVLVATAFTLDLKASRVPDYPDIQRAARLLPPEARVVVVYRFPCGCSPVVWLNRNILAIWEQPKDMAGRFTGLRQIGFTHVLILDIESWHNEKSSIGPLAWAGRLFQVLRKTPPATGANLPGFTEPDSPFRRYCDQHFSPLFVTPHVILYSMNPSPTAR
ncbi:MAG: hypothetical protein ABSA83_19990 [Verrucomicrobiota bacterium]